MSNLLIGSGVALLAAILIVLVARLRRPAVDFTAVLGRLDAADKGQERLERALREELGASRDAAATDARLAREEVGQRLMAAQVETARSGQALREELVASLQHLGAGLATSLGELARLQKEELAQFAARLDRQRDELATGLQSFSSTSELKLEQMRTTVDARLKQLQEENGERLEQMRATVDEKLQGTLEKRLGESFRIVSERLEQVHKGLGEMQTLAVGVGDLKKVLTNVKTRGGWGEVQLAMLLEQVLTPEQYATNVATREGTAERVEFAIRLPGKGGDGEEVLLPIDAKFPTEDYQRLVAAQEAADPVAADEAGRALETRMKGCARDIATKYLNPPRTTDFAVLFVPTEGLYAEVIRRPALVETLQREHRVIVAGPTTLAALLNSLQMGFRTLAVQKRSSEVWALLGAVKTEFGKFAGVLEGVQKKLAQASEHIDKAAVRTRAIERKLRQVEALPTAEAQALLPGEDEAYVARDLAELA